MNITARGYKGVLGISHDVSFELDNDGGVDIRLGEETAYILASEFHLVLNALLAALAILSEYDKETQEQ